MSSGGGGGQEAPAAVHIRRVGLFGAYFSGAFGLAANAMGNFLVPLRAHELGAGFDLIGLIVGAGALMPALFSVPLGKFIDGLGPRRAFMLGTSGTAMVAVLLALAPNPYVLLLLQMLFGLTRTLGWLSSQSYITSLGSVEERAGHTGRFSFFSNMGPMVGPLALGAAAQLLGFQLAFFVIALYALVFAAVGALLPRIPHDGGTHKKGTGFREAISLFALKGMQIALLLTFTRLWIEWAWNAFFPVYAVNAGIEPGIAGAIVTTKFLVAAILAPTASLWARRLGAEGATAVGLSVGAIGLLATPHLMGIPEAAVSGILVGVSAGLSLPLLLTIVSSAVPKAQLGLALGLRASVNQVAATGAPITVGPLIAALGGLMAFTVSGGVALLIAGTAVTLHLRRATERAALDHDPT